MTTAIIIFVCAALYAFYDYYKTQELKDLGFAIILFIGAVSTFIQTLNDNEQTDNIESLSKLDTSLSHHIYTLATIDTGLSTKANDLANQSLQISNQNKDLLSNVTSLTEQAKNLINSVNQKASYEAAENLSTGELKMNFTKQFHDNDMATIKIGGATTTTFISWIKKGGSFVNVAGKDLFAAHFINNKIIISLNVYDLYGNLIAEIENNNWRP
ncbi:MAG: hypothetical protein HYR66_10690, partial [Sphingobacteriales bacterium]|nr:hypothetical protein [Sphingobacteriales bacterium]